MYVAWKPSDPEDKARIREMARTIDDRIAPVRWAAGWPPYLNRPPCYEPDESPERRRALRGLPEGEHPAVELIQRKYAETSDVDTLRAERDELREAVDHQIIMRQVAVSNIYLLWGAAPDYLATYLRRQIVALVQNGGLIDYKNRPERYQRPPEMDDEELASAIQTTLAPPFAVIDSDGLPEWLANWFASTEQQPYVGMNAQEAVQAAEREGINEIRLIDLPFGSVFRLDYKPMRLNLAISEDAVIRAGLF
jgi:hypothetical protein